MNSFIQEVNFFEGNNPEELVKNFGTPLYVYNEENKYTKEILKIFNYKEEDHA